MRRVRNSHRLWGGHRLRVSQCDGYSLGSLGLWKGQWLLQFLWASTEPSRFSHQEPLKAGSRQLPNDAQPSLGELGPRQKLACCWTPGHREGLPAVEKEQACLHHHHHPQGPFPMFWCLQHLACGRALQHKRLGDLYVPGPPSTCLSVHTTPCPQGFLWQVSRGPGSMLGPDAEQARGAGVYVPQGQPPTSGIWRQILWLPHLSGDDAEVYSRTDWAPCSMAGPAHQSTWDQLLAQPHTGATWGIPGEAMLFPKPQILSGTYIHSVWGFSKFFGVFWLPTPPSQCQLRLLWRSLRSVADPGGTGVNNSSFSSSNEDRQPSFHCSPSAFLPTVCTMDVTLWNVVLKWNHLRPPQEMWGIWRWME